MRRARATKSRRSVLFASLAFIVFAGSCSEVDPEGCAAPHPVVASATNAALAPLLSESIRYSRAAALQRDARPIPDDIRAVLEPYFQRSTLDRVRWTVSSKRWTLDSLIASTAPRYGAITFDDTIVFLHEEGADDLHLWVHELQHVRQFKLTGGISNFSRVYLASWADIEMATVQNTNRILARLEFKKKQKLPSIRRNCGDS